jgi:hypothetical protein
MKDQQGDRMHDHPEFDEHPLTQARPRLHPSGHVPPTTSLLDRHFRKFVPRNPRRHSLPCVGLGPENGRLMRLIELIRGTLPVCGHEHGIWIWGWSVRVVRVDGALGADGRRGEVKARGQCVR